MLRPDTFALTAVLALLTAVGPLSVDMYLPSLPDIGRELAAPPAQVQLTISFYLVGFALGQIVYGPLSDRHGRKPILLAAFALFSSAGLACAFASSIEVLIIARFFQAFGGAGAVVLARAIVRDLYSEARAGREFSLMGAIMAVAPTIAPLIGSVLQIVFGWRAIFVGLLAVGSVAAALVWCLLPETLKNRAPEPVSLLSTVHVYRTFMKNSAFLAHLGIVTCSFMGLFAWISGASFVLQDLYDLSALEFGVAFALGSAGYMLGTVLAAGIVTHIGLDRTIGLGGLALAVGGLAMVAAVALGLTSAASLVLPAAFRLFAGRVRAANFRSSTRSCRRPHAWPNRLAARRCNRDYGMSHSRDLDVFARHSRPKQRSVDTQYLIFGQRCIGHRRGCETRIRLLICGLVVHPH
jgi:MFS transporter, DHA1 family, multidrug resistance protein